MGSDGTEPLGPGDEAAGSALERARAAHAAGEWARAFEAFGAADAHGPLGGDDLEKRAATAYLVAQGEAFVDAMQRAHRAFLDEGAPTRAARSAFWLGLTLMFDGQPAQAMGWLARARRVLDDERADCVERGYLLLPEVEKAFHGNDLDGAFARAGEAVAMAERFGDLELATCARHLQGRARLMQGRLDEGLDLLDEAMVAVTMGELSPRMTGLVYCSAIAACRLVSAFDRSHEWTEGLHRWCDASPSMLAFTGACMVHRAQLMSMKGAWSDAVIEAHHARERCARVDRGKQEGAAVYEQAEVHRMRGDHAEADAAYREAGALGFDPQPGLALLRLAQGDLHRAGVGIERALGETDAPLVRLRLLPAAVEIHVAHGAVETAGQRAGELADIATRYPTEMNEAWADLATGRVALARGAPAEAIVSLKRAAGTLQRAGAPYAHARARLLVAAACHALRDGDACAQEHAAARRALEQLDAELTVEQLIAWMGAPEPTGQPPRQGSSVAAGVDAPAPPGRPLTAREIEVLRLVADGKTSKAAAAALHLSVKTIDRHLSNVFDKLDVSSRAEAIAQAMRRGLL